MPDRSVAELAEALPISRPAVSRHLRVLKEAGLVTEEPRRHPADLPAAGRRARSPSSGTCEQVWGEAGTRFRLFAENTRAGGRDE